MALKSITRPLPLYQNQKTPAKSQGPAAIENMLLAAESLDIGSCWIGLARYYFTLADEVAKLKLPEGYEPCYAVTLGYKGARPKNALPRKADAVNFIE
jgi:nitroreductase